MASAPIITDEVPPANDWPAGRLAGRFFDGSALLSFDRERGGRARLGFSTNQPRTYGLTVRQSF